jgi:hypothetical protein
MNALLQEIVRYNGSSLGIKFMQQNNQPDFLILCPLSRSFNRELAACTIRWLFKKQEEAFTSITFEKGSIAEKEKKMNAAKVEAMLSESGLCKSNARFFSGT